MEVDFLRMEGRFLGTVGACGEGGLALCASEDKGREYIYHDCA